MKKRKGKIPILLGLLLLAAALFLTAANLYEGIQAEQASGRAADRLEERIPEGMQTEEPAGGKDPRETEIPDYVLNPEMEMPEEEVDGVPYIGMLRIPALTLELPVISGWSYPNLRIAPCRYGGSAYQDDLVIAAHNYLCHFGTLQNLQQGDAVTFTDVDGNIFSYEVAVIEVLEPTAIEEMLSGEYDLTLFTCTLGGASRVTVRCDRIKEHGR